jgi:hypothetical protein
LLLLIELLLLLQLLKLLLKLLCLCLLLLLLLLMRRGHGAVTTTAHLRQRMQLMEGPIIFILQKHLNAFQQMGVGIRGGFARTAQVSTSLRAQHFFQKSQGASKTKNNQHQYLDMMSIKNDLCSKMHAVLV